MTLKESYALLGLKEGSDELSVKQAYRRLAFEMHPDLHPDLADASKRFQKLNEAYVLVTQHLATVRQTAKSDKKDEATEKARQEAQRAYKKSKTQEEPYERKVYQEEVLKDILQDPFARRVFEDIYRHVNKREEDKKTSVSSQAKTQSKEAPKKPSKRSAASYEPPAASNEPSSGVVGKLKGWFKRQIDDEQEIRLPKASLRPGAVVRLEIQHGIVGKSHTIEIVLPENFKVGKAIRLKGLGKRVGGLAGDLYVKIIGI